LGKKDFVNKSSYLEIDNCAKNAFLKVIWFKMVLLEDTVRFEKVTTIEGI